MLGLELEVQQVLLSIVHYAVNKIHPFFGDGQGDVLQCTDYPNGYTGQRQFQEAVGIVTGKDLEHTIENGVLFFFISLCQHCPALLLCDRCVLSCGRLS